MDKIKNLLPPATAAESSLHSRKKESEVITLTFSHRKVKLSKLQPANVWTCDCE